MGCTNTHIAATTHYTEVCYLWFTPDEWEKAASESKVTTRDLAVADNFARVYTQFAKNGFVSCFFFR